MIRLFFKQPQGGIRFPRSASACVLLALSACGGGGTSGSSPSPTPTPPVVSVPAPTAATLALASVPTKLSAAQLGSSAWATGDSAAGGHGATVGGVTCLVTEDYHVHAHVAIIKNGELLALPSQIGLQGCAYELHTHDASGIVHVETAAYHRLTLGQLFTVWGQPLSSINVAGITGLPVSVYVNDGATLLKYTGDASADLELSNHRSFTIVLGTDPKEIPTYEWPAGL